MSARAFAPQPGVHPSLIQPPGGAYGAGASSQPFEAELGGRLFDEIRRRPARSLLIAAGTGFLAGGGLAATGTGRLLGAGARLALRLAIVPLFVDAFERAVSTPAASSVFLPSSTTNNVQQEMHS